VNRAFLAFVILCFLSLACGSAAPALKTVDDYVKEYGGNRESYQTILSLTDCASLQEQFNIASENNKRETGGTPQFKVALGYMKAADNRMKELDCYGASGSSPTTDIAKIVEGTANAANTLTQLAISPTLNVTSTFLPTLTPPATLAPSETSLPTSTVIFILPTNEPELTTVFILPTSPPPVISGSCSCSGDNLNCSDFSDHSSAQACFDYCIQQGAGDINKLDQDNDGDACEGN